MDKDIVALHKEILLSAMPEVSNYIATFRTINKRWAGAISAGMIEAGSMAAEVSNFFNPLIQDMLSTKTKYSQIQEQLVDAILFEMTKKVVFEVRDAAKFAINILKRNLFERTADVGYLATDTEIVSFLKLARGEKNLDVVVQRSEFVCSRLVDYQRRWR